MLQLGGHDRTEILVKLFNVYVESSKDSRELQVTVTTFGLVQSIQ